MNQLSTELEVSEKRILHHNNWFTHNNQILCIYMKSSLQFDEINHSLIL